MTEAEALQAVASFGDNAVGTFSNYTSVVFAYLVVAYFVGNKLSRFQAIIISGLYIAASTILAISNFATVQAWTTVVATTPTVLNTLPVYTMKWVPTYMAVLLAIGIFAGLYFMYNVRKHENEKR
jgi:hypothetical protein